MSEPAPQDNETRAVTVGQVVGLATASVLLVLALISVVTPSMPHIGQSRTRAVEMGLLAILAAWGTWHRKLWALVAACFVWYLPYPPELYVDALGTVPVLYLLAALLLFAETRAAERPQAPAEGGSEIAAVSQPAAAGEVASGADEVPWLTRKVLMQFAMVALPCCLLPIPGGVRGDSFGVFFGGSLGLIVPWLRFEHATLMGMFPFPGRLPVLSSPLGLVLDLALAAVLLAWAAQRATAWHLAIASLLLAAVWWPIAILTPLVLWLPFELICPEGHCAGAMTRLAVGAFLTGVVLIFKARSPARELGRGIGDFTGRSG